MIGGWGGGFESNLPSRRGWTRSYFNFNSGGVQLYFKAYFANFRTPPPDNYCTVPYCRVARQALPYYTAVAQFSFKRRTIAVSDSIHKL